MIGASKRREDNRKDVNFSYNEIIDNKNESGLKKSKRCVSQDELAAQVTAIYMAGYETTFTTLIHLTYSK